MEAQADSRGATLQVALNAVPTTSVTVACKVASGQSALPDSTTAADYQVTFSTSAASQGVRLGTVASISAEQDVVVTCAAVTAAGGLAAGDAATVTVAATPLKIVIRAGSGAVQPGGAAWAKGVALGPSDAVARLEGAADTLGQTLSVGLNGIPTAATVVACRSATPAYLSDGVASDYTVTLMDATAKDIKLGTVGDVRHDTDVSVVCSADGQGGVGASETQSVTVRALCLAIVIQAGTAARAADGRALTAGTALGPNQTVLFVEGTTDGPGLTLKLALNGNPSAGTTVTCASNNTALLPSPASSFGFTTTDGATPQNVTLPALAADVTADTTVTLTCTADGLGGIGTDEPASATILLRHLYVVMVAGSSAINDATGAKYAVGATSLTGKVRRVEAQSDSPGASLRVVLTGNPTADVTVTCTSSAPAVLPNPAASVKFTALTGTVAQDLLLPAVVDTLGAAQDVVVTCTPTPTGGLLAADAGSATVRAVPLTIQVQAGSAAVNESGVALTKGTVLSAPGLTQANAAGLEVRRQEGASDTAGASVQVALNGNPTASVTVTCQSQSTGVLPDSLTASDYTVTFSPANGTQPQGIRLGTVTTSTGIVRTPIPVALICTPTAGGGMATTDTTVFYVDAVPLAIQILAGASATLGAGAFPVAAGTALAAQDVVRVVAGASTSAGDLVQVVLSGQPGASVTVQCLSTTTAAISNPSTGTAVTFTASNGTTPQGILVGPPPPYRYEMYAVAGSAAIQATPTRSALAPGARLVSGQLCQTVLVYEGIANATSVVLTFSQASSATLSCTSSDTAAMGNMQGLAVSSSATLNMPLPAPAPLASGTKTITYTCTVASTPAPVNVTAGLTAKFDVVVAPLGVDVVVGTGSATRKLDGATVSPGTSIGYSTTPSDRKTLVVYEGAPANATLVALQLLVAPSAQVTFTCTSSDATKATSITGIKATSTFAVPFTVPSIVGISAPTTITFTCSPTASAGGYNPTSANHSAKFDLYVIPAQLTPEAGVGAVSAQGAALASSTVLLATALNPALEVVVYETDATNAGKVQLVPNVAPGAAGTVACASSNAQVMAPITGVQIQNSAAAVFLPLPSPLPVDASADVSYTCAPTTSFGNLATTDSVQFFVRVVALAVDAVAATTQTAADGSNLVVGTVVTGGGAGKTMRAYELQAQSSGTVALKANAAPSSPVTFACTSDTPAVMADIKSVVVSNNSPVAVTLPAPGAVAADATVTYTCAPTADVGGLKKTDTLKFVIQVLNLTVTPQSVVSGQLAADGTTTLAPNTTLVSGNLAKSVSIIELAGSSTQVVQLTPNATPSAIVPFRCASSQPTILADVSGLSLSSGSPLPVPMPQSAPIDSPVLVTYTCAPTSNTGGFLTTQTVSFDVRVVPLAATVLSASAQPSLAGKQIVVDATLAVGDATLTPVLLTTVAPNPGTVATLKSNGTPGATVSFTCASSNPAVMTDVKGIDITSAAANPINLPAPASVSARTVVTYTCAPVVSGFKSTQAVAFDVAVLPRTLRAVAAVSLTAADGTTTITQGSDISGAGPLSRAVVVYEGADNLLGAEVSLLVNVAPTAPVPISCVSSSALLADIQNVTVNNVTPVALQIPRALPVLTNTLVTYTCAPLSTAGGYDHSVSVTFGVLVARLSLDAVAGQSAGTAADGATRLSPGTVLTGTGSRARTLVVPQGTVASSTRVALLPSAPPQSSTTYACASSNASLLPDIPGIVIPAGGSTAVAVPLPAAGNVATDTVVTYTCTLQASAWADACCVFWLHLPRRALCCPLPTAADRALAVSKLT